MLISARQWAVLGRTMMLLSGAVLIVFPLYAADDAIHMLMKLWVMSFGAACIFTVLSSREP